MRILILALSVAGLASGQVFQPPEPRFEQNVGQFPEGYLFAGGGIAFERGRVQVNRWVALEFADSSPAALAPQGEAFRFNDYRSPDRALWRTGVPSYARLRQAGLHPGVDAEWRIENQFTRFRLTARAGADLQAVRLRFIAEFPLELSIASDDVWARGGGHLLGRPTASQVCPEGVRSVVVTYERRDPQTVGLTLAAPNPACPVNVDIPIGDPLGSWSVGAYAADSAGNVYMSSGVSPHVFMPSFPAGCYLGGFRPDGAPAFIAILSNCRPSDVKVGGGHVYLTGYTSGGFPVTPDAPQPAYAGGFADLFLARFRSDGVLVSATYFGGPGSDGLEQTALDADGNLYICGADGSGLDAPYGPSVPGFNPGRGFLVKWTPGLPRFAFAASFPDSVYGIAPHRDGSVALATRSLEGLPTTPGVLQRRRNTAEDLYVAKMDTTAGRLIWGTYLPSAGTPDSPGWAAPAALAIEPSGNLWIGGFIVRHPGAVNVLIKLQGDGSRVLFGDASPVRFTESSRLELDASANLLVVGPTELLAHPTAPDAPLRGGCDNSDSLYLGKFSPQGTLLYATYLRDGVAAFDGQGRPYLAARWASPPSVLRLELAAQPGPAIECLVNAAGRMTQSRLSGDPPALHGSIAPGQLLTLVGRALGPLTEAQARGDAAGRLPAELSGVRVLFEGVPAPILSAQYGMLTIYVPPDLLPIGSSATLQVEANGRKSAPVTVWQAGAAFQLASIDGHGFGQAAALNQDGSLNSPSNPARPGSVVSVWGTGAGINPRVQVFLNYSLPADVLFAGQAPGLAPGVTQVNFRVPDATPAGFAGVSVLPSWPGSLFPRVVISVGR